MMEYKGYTGQITAMDESCGIIHGRVSSINDIVTFEGATPKELVQAFHDSVDDYLAFCEERSEPPEKPFSGKFMVRASPTLHQQASLVARKTGEGAASSKLVEHTTVRLTLDRELDLRHARWLRGAIGTIIDRPEFHHHFPQGLLYQHPMIRYFVHGDRAIIAGLAEGAFLLRGLPAFERLRLGAEEYCVLNQSAEASRCVLGPTAEPIVYHFQSPYLALNQENYPIWENGDPFARRRLLKRVVVGNLLSLAKAISLSVSERLHAEVDLQPDGWHELKPDLQLLGFRGAVRVNFDLPEAWGIGKSSARGFGTLTRAEA